MQTRTCTAVVVRYKITFRYLVINTVVEFYNTPQQEARAAILIWQCW